MDEKTKTALIFGATIIMQEVCKNPRLSKAQHDKMRNYALILNRLAENGSAPADGGARIKPLTLEHGFDITNADGTPIDYDALGRKYKDKLCYCDIDGFYIGEDGQLVLMDDCGASVSVDRGDYHILARKPEEGEG